MDTALHPVPAARVSVAPVAAARVPAAGVPAVRPAAGPISPAGLGAIVRSVAAAPGQWGHLVRFRAGHRWYCRLEETASYEVWLLSWLPGQQTGFHDHGEACGAFAVAEGELLESTARPGETAVASRVIKAGIRRSFGPAYLHDVSNASGRPAVSVHAYSPPLPQMRRYELTPAGLRYTGTEPAGQSS
jgi:Cysteine dioxygenase type I